MTQSVESLLPLVESLEGLRAELTADPTALYTPLPHQAAFHLSPCLIRALIAGNQSAKSHAAGMEIVWYARGNWPDWVKTAKRVPVRRARSNPTGDPSKRADRHRTLPPGDTVIVEEDWSDRFAGRTVPERATNCRIIVPSYKTSAGIVEKVMGLLPPGSFRAFKNSQKIWALWEVDSLYGGTSTIELISDQEEGLSGEGWVGDLYVMDEPSSHARYRAHERGLMRRDGRVIMALTPLEGSAWIKERIYDRGIAGDPDIHVTTVDCWANCDENGGFVSRRRLLHFLDGTGMSEEERLTRETGAFLHLSGRALTEFDEEHHVFDEPTDWAPPPWWTTAHWIMLHDPHPRRAPVTILAAIGHDDRICIVDEYPRVWPDGTPYLHREVVSDPHTFERHVEAINAMLDHWRVPRLELAVGPWPMYDVEEWCDPRGGAQSQPITGSVNDGRSWMSRMADYGHPCAQAPIGKRSPEGEIHDGLNAIRTWLAWDRRKPIGPGNQPRLGVLRRCHNTVWAFLNWSWAEKRPTKDGRVASEKRVQEIGKDHIDLVRYLTFVDPRWFDKVRLRLESRSRQAETEVDELRERTGYTAR